jgi:type I restriction enzyme, S subunit
MTPAHWTSLTVESCLEPAGIRSGPGVQTKDYRREGSYPIVDQSQNRIAGWTNSREFLIEAPLPLIVFGDHTRIFKFIDFPFVRGADGTQVLKPRSGIDPRFFFYALRAVNLQSRGYNRHFTMLKSAMVPLPPFEEQVLIAQHLRLLDTAVEHHVKQMEIAERLNAATLNHLFRRGVCRETPKETEIGKIPGSWTVADFRSVREWLQYGTSVRCSAESGRYPVLRIPNIEPARVNSEDLKYCDLSLEIANRYRLEAGDLIFIRTNGVLDRLGSCAVYLGEPKDALFASYLIRARVRSNVVDPRFAAYFYSSRKGTQLIASRATPASDGKYNLNTSTIDSLSLPVPPTLDEQREIVSVLECMDHKIAVLRRKTVVTAKLFHLLLRGVMSGAIPLTEVKSASFERLQLTANEAL